MTAAALPLADPDDVDRLGDDLRAAGYDADGVPDLLGAGAHNALGRGHRWPALHVTAAAAAGGSRLATLVRLFLLGTTEPADAVAAALSSLSHGRGLAAGVLERDGDGLRAAVDVRPHADDERGYLVVSDLDSDVRPGPVRPDHVLGIGAASVTLARAVIREPVGSVLDVGTGCGIQALHCAGHAGSVTATDTNPRALTLAAATARLNGQRWDLRAGSLFQPVAGERFDLVVSNPPFVISPGVRRFEYRDSGMAGDELCRRLVRGLPEHLAPGGTGQLLANWLIPAGADWRERVGGWLAGTGCDGWVVQREVADPAEYVSLWLADTGETGTEEAAGLAAEWLDYFREQRVVGIGMGLITLRNSGSADPDVVLDELTGAGDEVTGAEAAGFLARRAWLRGRTDADLLGVRLALSSGDLLEQRALPGGSGWTTVLRMLRRPGGPGATVQLDEWGQALLGGCTGAVPLGVQVELLAAAHRLDPAALAAAVLPAVRTAITRGLLHPVTTD
jgi:methylase of polypeptide subunit release factors